MKKPHAAKKNLTSLRIGRGTLGGRLIRFPIHEGLRPTPTKVREAVFSILGEFAASHGFLDLCAGSGAMGFQALSMGFHPVIFLEAHGTAARQLRTNAENLGVSATIWNRSAYDLKAGEINAGCWVLYADPPYKENSFHPRMMDLLGRFAVLAAGSLYVAETERDSPPPHHPAWHLWKQKQYGRTMIGFYQNNRPDPASSAWQQGNFFPSTPPEPGGR